MNTNIKWSQRRKAQFISAKSNSHYKEIHQKLLNLNLFKHLPSFNTRKYDSREYFTVLEQASIYRMSIKQTCLMQRFLGRWYPSPEQVMKCCREISSERMANFVNSALKLQFNALPKKIQQQLYKSRILIIDFHQDCYYGNKTNPHVKKSRVKKSTNLFYEYLTADLYCKNGCFTIALFHRTPGECIFSLMKKLLEHVQKIISIKTILFDGEFATLDILQLLIQKGIKFLGRKSRTDVVKVHIDKYYQNSKWINNRKWRPIRLHSWKSICKNLNVEICPQNIHGVMKFMVKSPGWDIKPEYAEKLYRKRFNIETGYRDKHKFQLFTCTKILSTRLLVFLMATLLWNCWQCFLIWLRSLKSYTRYLPREFQIQISANWFKNFLGKIFHDSQNFTYSKEGIQKKILGTVNKGMCFLEQS